MQPRLCQALIYTVVTLGEGVECGVVRAWVAVSRYAPGYVARGRPRERADDPFRDPEVSISLMFLQPTYQRTCLSRPRGTEEFGSVWVLKTEIVGA
jgi:hypothetical protein